jgi:hypothetical protein
MNLRRNAALIASLMMSGLMPMGSGPDREPLLDHGRRSRPISPPYSPPKREPPPLTPEQIKAAEKRTRKAKRLAKESNDGTQ